MINVLIRGLRDKQFRERVLLKSLKTLTKAANYKHFAETATRVTKHNPASFPITTIAINPRGVIYGDARQSGDRNQQQQQPQKRLEGLQVSAWTRTTNAQNGNSQSKNSASANTPQREGGQNN